MRGEVACFAWVPLSPTCFGDGEKLKPPPQPPSHGVTDQLMSSKHMHK